MMTHQLFVINGPSESFIHHSHASGDTIPDSEHPLFTLTNTFPEFWTDPKQIVTAGREPIIPEKQEVVSVRLRVDSWQLHGNPELKAFLIWGKVLTNNRPVVINNIEIGDVFGSYFLPVKKQVTINII